MTARITNQMVMAELAEIRALLTQGAPAKAPTKAAVAKAAPAKKVTRKAPAKARKATTKAPTKGGSAAKAGGGTLSAKDWNRTLTAKARFAGGGTYKLVLARWADAQEARKAGATPDAFLEAMLAGA